MTSGFADVDGLLLDIDGVLAVSWQPIAGSVEAMRWIRERGLPFRLITNTTTHTRSDLAATLGSAGFDVAPEEIVTVRSRMPGRVASGMCAPSNTRCS